MTSALAGKDILSIADIGRVSLDEVMVEAERLRPELQGVLDLLRHEVLSTGFFEPSTRTRLSFQFAMVKMEGEVVDFVSSMEAFSVRARFSSCFLAHLEG